MLVDVLIAFLVMVGIRGRGGISRQRQPRWKDAT